MFRAQYIACNTDTYDAEAFRIYNMIEAITAMVRECYITTQLLGNDCQNIIGDNTFRAYKCGFLSSLPLFC